MYRFIRSARIVSSTRMPAALQFAVEVTDYLNKQYSLDMKIGVGTLGHPIIQWHFDLDSADELATLNNKLSEDLEYLALVEKYKYSWFAKSMEDTLVNVAR